MSTPDFSNLCPPADMTGRIATARWGAQYAAEQLANRWPEPITDRRPTEADADEHGFVQELGGDGGYWEPCRWDLVHGRSIGLVGWRHSPSWTPKPLTEAQQIAAELRGRVPGDCIRPETLIRAAELLEAIQ